MAGSESSDERGAPRADGRGERDLRPLRFEAGWTDSPDGSVLVRQGRTRVLCTATVEEWLPPWRRDSGAGWVTATYRMVPGAGSRRTPRDRSATGGRTKEIERLIGRALRSAVDLPGIGARTMHVDCDVLQADGGTRTAAVSGGWLALALAVDKLRSSESMASELLTRQIAAVSVGVVGGRTLLDLDYSEDVRAQTDMNVVMTGDGQYVEVQATAEGPPLERTELDRLLEMAETGIRAICEMQSEVRNGS